MSDHTTRQSPEVKNKLCECGCGQPTTIALQTNKRKGHVKGQPVRYLMGHGRADRRVIDADLTVPSGTKAIPLTQGQVAIVDAADFERLSQHRWRAFKGGHTYYAARHIRLPSGKWTSVKMHREILNASPDMAVDHVDGNGLNNTKDNLRLCTPRENSYNQRRSKSNKSGYKGVSWHEQLGKWQVGIKIDGRTKHLGVFTDIEDAARAYDDAALEFFGEFAQTNLMGATGNTLPKPRRC